MNKFVYKSSRLKDFNRIKENLESSKVFDSSKVFLAGGDALELIRKIPDNSISLILTDPPYHSTKKKNIKNDTAFSSDDALKTVHSLAT